jgi:CheY-like chemotaxis protein
MDSKRKIAIVDDTEDNRFIVRKVLEREFLVADYADGESALEELSIEPPDLILLDICMPEMDGFEVLRRLRAHPTLHNVCAVAFTACASAEDIVSYHGAGFDHFIGKPVLNLDHLLTDVRELVDRLVLGPRPTTSFC